MEKIRQYSFKSITHIEQEPFQKTKKPNTFVILLEYNASKRNLKILFIKFTLEHIFNRLCLVFKVSVIHTMFAIILCA